MKIWFSKSGNITLRLYVFLIVYLLLFLQKHIENSDHQETIRRCSRYEFFTSDFIDTCEDIQSLITQLTINHYSISKLPYQNLNSFSHLLLLLPGDISLNPGPVHQDKLECLNEWNVSKNRGLHFIHLNINSLLPKIDELRYITKSTNAAVIGISESTLDGSVLDPEIINNYKILRCDRNRQGGGVACYVRNDLSYNTLSVFPREVENIFFEILLPNSKPLTVGTIYRPPNQSNFLEILNHNMNKIDSVNNKIYILGDFKINLYINDSYILAKKNVLNNKSVPSDVKSYQGFCIFFGSKQLIIVPTRVTTGSSTIIDHVLASFPERVAQSGVIDVGLSDHQLIYCTRKISRIKRGSHKQIKFRSFKHYIADLFEQELFRLNFPNYWNFNDINEACNDFIQKIMNVIDKVATLKERQVKQNSQEWFDGEIADEIKNHVKLFRKFKKSKLQIDKDIYVARYKLQKMIINKKKSIS